MLLYPDATAKFVKESGRLRTASSRSTYIHSLRSLQNMFPRTPVHRFDEHQLTTFCLSGVNPSPATIKTRRTILTSFFGWAQWAGLCPTTPAVSLKYSVTPGNHGVRHHHWLTEAQVGTVLSSIDTSQPLGQRSMLCALPGFMNGLRLFEIAGLRWNKFSTDLSEVELVGKGNKPVTVAVAPQWASALRPWREVCQGHQARSDGPVLPRRHHSWGEIEFLWDKATSTQAVYKAIVLVSDHSKVMFRPHDMRRTFAGILEGRGFSIEDISAALRHESIATTQRYLEKNPARAHKVTSGFRIEF